MEKYHGAPLSSDGKSLTSHGDPVFTEKIHVTKKRRVKNFHDPIEVRIGFFGYETNQQRMKAVIAVELTESFVLTGYDSHNSKRA